MKTIRPINSIRSSGGIHAPSRMGVIADSFIPKGGVIEKTQAIIIPQTQHALINQTVIKNYLCNRGEEKKERALLLGSCALYRHSDLPNALCIKNFELNTIVFRAICDIFPDEEITIDYFHSEYHK